MMPGAEAHRRLDDDYEVGGRLAPPSAEREGGCRAGLQHEIPRWRDDDPSDTDGFEVRLASPRPVLIGDVDRGEVEKRVAELGQQRRSSGVALGGRAEKHAPPVTGLMLV